MEAIPTGAALGVEIQGIDIREPLSPEEVAFIRDAWHAHLVLVVREQLMTERQHMTFSENFGELEYSGANLFKKNYSHENLGNFDGVTPPQIAVVSNITVDGKPIGSLGSGEAKWHTDSSLVECPPAGGFLHAREIPDTGGATSFLNMYLALETMPADLRRRIEGRQIHHPATHSSNEQPRKGFENFTDIANAPGTDHPIIRVHPDTGRQALYLGRRLNATVVGLPLDESDDLLNALWSHATQERFVYRHEWKVGDLVVWDNRCCMHKRESFDPDSRRLMHRTQTRGERPFGPVAEAPRGGQEDGQYAGH